MKGRAIRVEDLVSPECIFRGSGSRSHRSRMVNLQPIVLLKGANITGPCGELVLFTFFLALPVFEGVGNEGNLRCEVLFSKPKRLWEPQEYPVSTKGQETARRTLKVRM